MTRPVNLSMRKTSRRVINSLIFLLKDLIIFNLTVEKCGDYFLPFAADTQFTQVK